MSTFELVKLTNDLTNALQIGRVQIAKRFLQKERILKIKKTTPQTCKTAEYSDTGNPGRNFGTVNVEMRGSIRGAFDPPFWWRYARRRDRRLP